MTAADEARAEAERILREEVVQDGVYETRDVFVPVDVLRSLTAQLQAAQATIKAAYTVAMMRSGKAAARVLSRADLSSLAEHDKQVAAKALEDVAQLATLWERVADAHGSDDTVSLIYVYRSHAADVRASIEQTEGECEPQPEDGPDYHAEHAYWLARHPANPPTTPKESR